MIKTAVANFIWRICKISPEAGNKVMDLSEKLYDFAMWNHTN